MNERAATRCLLYADVAGRIRLAVKLGEAEAGYAVERCLNRMSRCAEAYSAEGLELRPEVIVAHFGDADSALLAAREMRERVRALPPMSGIKLVLRAGVVLESEGGGRRRWGREDGCAVGGWLQSGHHHGLGKPFRTSLTFHAEAAWQTRRFGQ